MSYLLDTDICVYLLNQSDSALMDRFKTIQLNQISISTLTEAELYYGALHSAKAEENQERVGRFVDPLRRLPFDSPAAKQFALIKECLLKTGKPSGVIDMLIAAQALSHQLIIVTNNTKHYTAIPNLQVENWVRC